MASPAVIASVKSFDCEKSLWQITIRYGGTQESQRLLSPFFVSNMTFFPNNRENKMQKYFDNKDA